MAFALWKSCQERAGANPGSGRSQRHFRWHPQMWQLPEFSWPPLVWCLAQGSHLSRGIEGGESAGYSLPPPTIPARPEIRTHNLLVTSPTRYPLSHDCPRYSYLYIWSGMNTFATHCVYVYTVYSIQLSTPYVYVLYGKMLMQFSLLGSYSGRICLLVYNMHHQIFYLKIKL